MQIGVQNDQLSNRRKRIVINIDKHSRKARQSNNESDSMFNPQKQLPKLMEISERCFQYYDKFKEDRLDEEQYMEVMFSQLLRFLEESFKDLIHKLTTKQTELKNAVLEKKKQFLNFHPNHFLSLTQKVQQIKQQKTCLQRLTPQQTSIFTINFNSQGQMKQNQYSEFAKLLNSFYNEIEVIEKNSFKDSIRESTGFLRNLIKDQFDIFNKRIGQEIESTPNGNISFNNEQLFSIKQFRQQNSEGAWEEFRSQTQQSQRQLEIKIDNYSFKMKVF